MLFAGLFAWLNSNFPAFWLGFSLPGALLFFSEMTAVGALIGGRLFGIYLFVSSSRYNMNHNDAFSSMRLDSHRNFLRLRIKGDEVQIFPIGLTNIPKRHEWRVNDKKIGTPAPAYVPIDPLKPHLIEGPVIVDTAKQLEKACPHSTGVPN